MLRRNFIFAVLLTFCLAFTVFITVSRMDIFAVNDHPKTWVVPVDFPNITSAIQSPEVLDGDTILVLRNPNDPEGAYREGQINVTKSLNITADTRWGEVVVDGMGKGDVFNVTADNVVIKGFKITNSSIFKTAVAVRDLVGATTIYVFPAAGIRLSGVENCTLDHNFIYNNSVGIIIGFNGSLYSTSGISIIGGYTENCNITNNDIEHNRIAGISTVCPATFDQFGRLHSRIDPSYSDSANLQIKNNTILSNGWGVYDYYPILYRIWSGIGGLVCRGSNLKIIGNTVRNNTQGRGGIEVGGCGLIVSDNTIQNNSAGLSISYYYYYPEISTTMGPPYLYTCTYTFIGSTDIVVENNKIERNKFGLSIDYCNNTMIRNNTIFKNQWNFGLHIDKIEDASTIQLEPSNFADGGRIYYFVNQSNLLINSQTLPNAGYLAVANSENLTVYNLEFSKNIQGLYLFNVKKFDVYNVTVKNCYLGIETGLSSNGVIRNCTFLWNDNNDLYIRNSTMNLITESIFKSNASANICIFEGSKDRIYANKIINAEGYGVYLSGCEDESLFDNYINATVGIYLDGGFQNEVFSNKILAREKGLVCEWSDDNKILYNEIQAINGTGILVFSDSNIISKNIVWESKCGIELEGANGNLIYGNDFIHNVIQAQATNSTDNKWDIGSQFGGNFWSNYNGTDSNGDGIGDTPYVIDEYNIDRYPLMYPCNPHDIAVESIEISGEVAVNQPINISVTVTNLGVWTEKFNLNLKCTVPVDLKIGNQTITLVPKETLTLSFSWTPPTSGIYEFTAYTSLIAFDVNMENNRKTAIIYVGGLSVGGNNGRPALLK